MSERDEFEKWYSQDGEYGGLPIDRYDLDGDYMDDFVQSMWMAWQAAPTKTVDESTKQRAETCDSIFSLLDEVTPEWLDRKGTGEQCALYAIRDLADARDEAERLRERWKAAEDGERLLMDTLDSVRDEAEKLRARADACQQEAQIWRQEARAQSATVAKIYQELTGKTGEPGDWNGARPLVPAILRKQAEKLDEIAKLFKEADENGVATVASIYEGLVLNSISLRQQADEAEGK